MLVARSEPPGHSLDGEARGRRRGRPCDPARRASRCARDRPDRRDTPEIPEGPPPVRSLLPSQEPLSLLSAGVKQLPQAERRSLGKFVHRGWTCVCFASTAEAVRRVALLTCIGFEPLLSRARHGRLRGRPADPLLLFSAREARPTPHLLPSLPTPPGGAARAFPASFHFPPFPRCRWRYTSLPCLPSQVAQHEAASCISAAWLASRERPALNELRAALRKKLAEIEAAEAARRAIVPLSLLLSR